MTYNQAVEKIHSLLLFGSRPGLGRILKLMEKMGNPQDEVKFIHVAGTNGKGSTSAMLSQILKAAGYKTGLFISPYVINFRERIQINNEMIPEKELAAAVEKWYPAVQQLSQQGDIITEFEFINAIAFYWYAKCECDVVVLETGMGGTMDCTNIIKTPLASVITSISYDHTAVLGQTIAAITKQKAGIIKEGGNTVFYPQETEVNEIIDKTASEKHNTITYANKVELEVASKKLTHTEIIYNGNKLKLPLIGRHQIRNAKIVLATIERLNKENLLKIKPEHIERGIEQAKMPARLELLSEKPIILLDGAHNPDGMRALAQTIEDYFPNKNIVCIMGMLQDKDSSSSLEFLDDLVQAVITLGPENPRKQTAQELAEKAVRFFDKVYPMESFTKAIDKGIELAGEDGVLLICGSLYLASQLRPLILRKFGKEEL